MKKCDYCRGELSETHTIYLEHFHIVFKVGDYGTYSRFFCSKKCLMSYISESCRKVGIKSEEEEVWE